MKKSPAAVQIESALMREMLSQSWPADVRRKFLAVPSLTDEEIEERRLLEIHQLPAPEGATEPRCAYCRDSGMIIDAAARPIDGVGIPPVECDHCDLRASRLIVRYQKIGAMPRTYRDYTPEGYVQRGGPEANLKRAKAMGARPPHSIYITGPIGTGKTYLSTTFIYQPWAAQLGGLWFALPDLLEYIRKGYDRATRTYQASELLEAVSVSPLLYVDDVGAERVNDWVEEQLYRFVSRRSDERRVTIFTSNLALDALEQHLGERIASRIEGMCDGAVIPMAGKNLRKAKREAVAS